MSSWVGSFSRLFTSTTDKEAEAEAARIEKRNRLKQLGLRYEQEAVRLAAAWEIENRVYDGQLRASQNNPKSPYYAKAAEARQKRDKIGGILSVYQARYRDIETFLTTTEVRDLDQEFARLMGEVVNAEKTAPRALTRQDVNKIMLDARGLAEASVSLQDDMSNTELSGVVDTGSLYTDMSSDYSRLTSPATTTPTGAAPRRMPSELAEAEALDLILRGQGGGGLAASFAAGQ
jgi:hypothetical protein